MSDNFRLGPGFTIIIRDTHCIIFFRVAIIQTTHFQVVHDFKPSEVYSATCCARSVMQAEHEREVGQMQAVNKDAMDQMHAELWRLKDQYLLDQDSALDRPNFEMMQERLRQVHSGDGVFVCVFVYIFIIVYK